MFSNGCSRYEVAVSGNPLVCFLSCYKFGCSAELAALTLKSEIAMKCLRGLVARRMIGMGAIVHVIQFGALYTTCVVWLGKIETRFPRQGEW